MTNLSQYANRNVFWGRELPRIALYDDNWNMIDEWRFESLDNFRMEHGCLRVLDAENEMENGIIRQRLRGFRLFTEFQISNIENRDVMLFLRKMFNAPHVVFTPHYGSMWNPNNNSYDFEMMIDADFEPQYYDGRFIGHNISWRMMSVELFSEIPRDYGVVSIIEATTIRSAGVTSADPQTAMTYPGEKMIYGGWELTEEDFNAVAFIESRRRVKKILTASGKRRI